jgi:hypothetical protein
MFWKGLREEGLFLKEEGTCLEWKGEWLKRLEGEVLR